MQQAKRRRKKHSIFSRLVWLFILVAVLDVLLLLSLLFAGGTFQSMRENSLSILSEVTHSKQLSVESKLNAWADLDELSDEMTRLLLQTLESEAKTTAAIATDPALNAQLMMTTADIMVEHIQNQDISGLFLVLDGMGIPDDAQSYAGVYIRDTDPANRSYTTSDLHLLRGLPPFSRATGLTLDSFWQAAYHFEGGEEAEQNAFFYRPLQAYRAGNGVDPRYCGYWSGRFSMHENDNVPIFTYSRPLVDSEGNAFGVLGIELDARYMAAVINDGDYSERSTQYCYFLGYTKDGGKTYQNVLTSGVSFRRNFMENQNLTLGNNGADANGYFSVSGSRTGTEMTGVVYELELYSPNTMYSNNRWALIGLQANDTLFEMVDHFREAVVWVTWLGLLFGFVLAIVAAQVISRPITALAGQLRTHNKHAIQSLEPTGIGEIDVLADTVVQLNKSLVEDASRISKIITLSGLPIGAFEAYDDEHRVFCSDGFFDLLGYDDISDENNNVDMETFERMMRERIEKAQKEDDDVYRLNGDGVHRYIRLRLSHDPKGITGTIMDVTEEMENRRRIEHERDYDALTNILNRRAFETMAEHMFEESREALEPVSALLMVDIDNLKPINDSYGHDCGDRYIRAFARALERLRGAKCLLGRRSGDEFYLFYYGYPSKEEIRNVIDNGWDELLSQSFDLPDGTTCKMRASAGIAWYPDQANEYMPLLHYADFAMYRVKNAAKGTIKEFSRSDYAETGYLFNGTQALDRLLEEKLVRYMLQPIVSADDGSVAGYELLMRPQVEELPSPMTVLNIARRQGKLYRVERLTLEKGLETIQNLREEGKLKPGVKIFINSIASQILTEEDEQELAKLYSHLYGDMVLEITENEHNSESYMSHKLAKVKSYGGSIAIDDFGTGYNSDTSLITIDAAYVKLDISFVRDVDKDSNKLSLIDGVIKYSKRRNIKVIAEGVETYGEMETLSRLGVDYFQGYYVGRPSYEPTTPAEEVQSVIQNVAQKYKNKRGGGNIEPR